MCSRFYSEYTIETGRYEEVFSISEAVHSFQSESSEKSNKCSCLPSMGPGISLVFPAVFENTSDLLQLPRCHELRVVFCRLTYTLQEYDPL